VSEERLMAVPMYPTFRPICVKFDLLTDLREIIRPDGFHPTATTHGPCPNEILVKVVEGAAGVSSSFPHHLGLSFRLAWTPSPMPDSLNQRRMTKHLQ